MIALAAGLSLLFAPPALRTMGEMPGELQIDGALTEWAGATPTLLLGPASQVAGPSKTSSPADFSAKVWIAWGEAGLVIAGEVTDDIVHLQLPGTAPSATADHLEIWLSLPPASLPPIAYVNQFAEQKVPTAKACATIEGLEDVKACEAWFAKQVKHRARIERASTRQYLVSPAGLAETWSTAKDVKDPSAPPVLPGLACCRRAKSAVVAGAPGWRFEVLIPPEDFPPTAQLPLRDARVLVDLVDADDGIAKLESFFSSSPARKFGKPETFLAVPLPAPRGFDAFPPLLGDLMKEHPGLLYQPGAPVPIAWALENLPRGYQYQPEEPSPSVTMFALGKLPTIAEAPDLKVYETPIGIRALHRDKVAGTLKVDGTLVANVVRRGQVHLLFYDEGTMHPLGTGACGACPAHALTLLAIDEEGTPKSLFGETIVEQSPMEEGGRTFSYEEIEVFFEKDLSSFGFRGKKMGENDTAKFLKRWKWDSQTRTYVLEGES